MLLFFQAGALAVCAELWSVCIVCHLKSFSFAKTCVHTHDEEKGSDQLGLSSPL